ncbi:caltractin-like [Amaranthus tricolor]|uniref:caltractin-like n=1 Tax=Amaranthus tricolor TaxID=29722 RepID=UPI00258A1048|nr:caltractin-like [Amaranthus tricolor]
MIDEVVNNESETSDDSSSSDDPKSPQNVPNDYEKQRELRISQNRAKMEAMGLKKIANSLVDSGIKRKSQLKSKSKRVSMNGVEDDLYNPNDEDEDDDSDSSLNSSSEELEEDQKGKKKNKKKKNKKILNVTNSGYASKKVKSRKPRSNTQNSLKKSVDVSDATDLLDVDEALKEAIALSLKDFRETSDQQIGKTNEHTREASTRKRKSFKSSVQMTEDDLVINFCQFDEIGKGSITLRDLQRMAASHDFTWTDKELADMIQCFDSDKDGKLTLDDFRNIVLRCNILQVPQNP